MAFYICERLVAILDFMCKIQVTDIFAANKRRFTVSGIIIAELRFIEHSKSRYTSSRQIHVYQFVEYFSL